MKNALLLLVPFLFGSALAETYVPNSKVSYRVVNSSHVYLDADKGEDFVEFYCSKGTPVFYLNTADPVMTQDEFDAEKSPNLTYQVDAQAAKTLPTVVVEEGDDDSHLGVTPKTRTEEQGMSPRSARRLISRWRETDNARTNAQPRIQARSP